MGRQRLPGRRTRDERGAAAVEFALVAMVFFTLLFGVIQFCLWMWAYQVGSHAAREGARVAAVNPCDLAPAKARAEARIGGAGTGYATPTSPPSPVKVGDEVTITVTLTAQKIAGLMPALPTITKSATARIENVPAGGC